MGKQALKYGSFINILLMEAWFLHNWFSESGFSWEPAFLFITSLFTFLYLEYKTPKVVPNKDNYSIADEIRKLVELEKEEHITKEEFEASKMKLIWE